MEAIRKSKSRVGNFTSSEIGNLMKLGKDGKSFGAPARSYIEEKNMERRLGRALSVDTSSRPTSWGKLVEKRVLEKLLGIEYKPCSTDTILHSDITFWAGSPDAVKEDTVVDIKCPLTLKSFCQMVDCVSIDELRARHKEGETYYWQLVSNAILTHSKFAELVVYVPYQIELAEIRDLASNQDECQNKVAWTNWAEDDDLPYLIEGGFYKNLNVIRFEIPEADKALLTAKVEAAGKLLIDIKPAEVAA